MNNRHKHEGPGTRSVMAAVLGAVVLGVLLVAAGTHGGVGVVGDAAAAGEPAATQQYEYFPANFASPDGPVEPHIEAF